MRFEYIEINNYRQYKKLKFCFNKTKDNDLYIIEGTNGLGKTNILNAIVWCLYGDEPHLGDQSRSLPKINLEHRAEAESRGENQTQLSVKIYAKDNNQLITFVRILPIKVSNCFEHESQFFVTINDDNSGTRRVSNEEAKEYVDMFMPKRIREYFFFDGEQLHNYFSNSQTSNIKDSIHAISQVDLLSRIKDRLDKVMDSKQKEAGKKGTNIEELNEGKKAILAQIESLKKEIEQITSQISISEKIISKNSELLRGQEDVSSLEQEYETLNRILADRKVEKRKNDIEMNQFVRDYFICVSLYPSIKKTLSLIREKERNGLLPPDIDKNFLERMVSDKTCHICNRTLDSNGVEHILELIKKLQVSSITSNILMRIKSDMERKEQQAKQYAEKKKELFSRISSFENETRLCEEKLKNIDDKLKNYSDKEKVVTLHKEREEHKKIIESNLQRKGASEITMQSLQSSLAECEVKIMQAISKQKDCEHIKNILSYADKIKKVTSEIECEMMGEVREKIRLRTMYYFDKLIWKENTYQKIELDDKYKLDLIHKEGYSCVGSCSAAERALLALAFTLALHEVSGFNALLFIDTPVSRVSDVNRENFARILSEVSKDKQIILTFAPSEYSDEIKEIFGPVCSGYFKLLTDNERVTKLKEN